MIPDGKKSQMLELESAVSLSVGYFWTDTFNCASGIDLKVSTPSFVFVCLYVCAYILSTILEALTGCEYHFWVEQIQDMWKKRDDWITTGQFIGNCLLSLIFENIFYCPSPGHVSGV